MTIMPTTYRQVPGDGFSLPVSSPHPPDFLHCNERYGSDLSTLDCAHAANAFPRGAESETYVNDGGSGTFSLPQVRKHGLP